MLRSTFRVCRCLGVLALLACFADAVATSPPESAQTILGRSVFATEWVSANSPDASQRRGLGPLFNARSCNECHAGAERGRAPEKDGAVPAGLVIHLEPRQALAGGEIGGDPVYGRVLNTQASDGLAREGTVTVTYTESAGYYYPFGGRWVLRIPHYHLQDLKRGPLAADTVIKARLAPSLFGVGLLEAVPERAITEIAAGRKNARTAGVVRWHLRQGRQVAGRFGWQTDAVSILDQTATAFALDMGLTSAERPSDDCTPLELDCRRSSIVGAPEVSEELLAALVAFQRNLVAPSAPARTPADALGAELFRRVGCADCHRPQLPVELPANSGDPAISSIAAYTDLRLHDLGMEMADETVSGVKVVSRWRTAPLWGLSHRMASSAQATFLHDGRAKSAEEAVLWHFGEASYSRYEFARLGPRARESLLRWLATL